jgi:hypothetical protein
MPSKYHAVQTNGYASKKEFRRAQELQLLQKCGEISDLQEQVKFELLPKCGKERACCYIADFTYRDKNGNLVVEDTKGVRTDAYVIKRKMMLFFHKIAVYQS